jgi:hypothetical protein
MSLFSVFRRSPPKTSDPPPTPTTSGESSSAPTVPTTQTPSTTPSTAAASSPSVLQSHKTPDVSIQDLSVERMKERLTTLIRIPSTIGQEEAAIQFFLSHFNDVKARNPEIADRVTIDFWIQEVSELFSEESTVSSSTVSTSIGQTLSTSTSTESTSTEPTPTESTSTVSTEPISTEPISTELTSTPISASTPDQQPNLAPIEQEEIKTTTKTSATSFPFQP